MNSVVLIGRLTRDPEVRYISESQMAIATFTVAIDRPTRSGQEKKTDFPRVTVFGRQAENCEKFLTKGRLVGVQGRIQTGSYTNRDGATVYTTDVVADRVEFLEWGDRAPRSGGNAGGQQGQQYAQPQQQGAKGMSIAAMVCGIIGLILCWIPFVGLIINAMAIIFYILSRKEAPNGMATAGLVCGIIGLVVALIIARPSPKFSNYSSHLLSI